MIRVLVMIAVAGFVLAVATFAVAVAIGGPDVMARGGWALASRHWDDGDWDGRHHRHRSWSSDSGPQTTRTIEWSGADGLDVDLPADIRYIQQAGPATVTVTGPQQAVERVVVRGDSIRYDDRGRHHWGQKLSIVVRAPNIRAFDLSGQNELTIEGYHQDSLSMDVSGSAEVVASGETNTIALDISGNGDVDLGQLKAKGADVEISGAGDATIAPTDWAKLDISGMGDIRLLTHPPRLETDVSGAGSIRQGEAPSVTPSPSPSPSSSPSPSPKSSKL